MIDIPDSKFSDRHKKYLKTECVLNLSEEWVKVSITFLLKGSSISEIVVPSMKEINPENDIIVASAQLIFE